MTFGIARATIPVVELRCLRLSWLLALQSAAASLGCDANAPSIAGSYRFDASSVITAVNQGETCGLPALPTNQYLASFAVAEPHGGTATVTEMASECTFPAQIVGSQIVANGVECNIPASSPARTQWGAFRTRYAEFSIDSASGLLRASSESWRKLADDPNNHSCHTVEGRLLDSKTKTSPGGDWSGYETSFLFSREQPDADADCGPGYFSGTTSGSMGVKRTANGGVTLHWEGMDCDVDSQNAAGGPITASATQCRLGPDTGLARFSVESVEFDSLEFDPATHALAASGRFVRAQNGQRSSLCFKIPDDG